MNDPKNVNTFLPEFKSERLFQQAIACLLARMPSISGVQILQSALEYGKDIVFKTCGPLEEPINCACVLKNTKITGQVGSRGSARALFDQIEQALDIPYLDGSGQSIQIHKVYVMNPFMIPPTTMGSIADKMKSRFGQVTFFCGSELYTLFRKYWTDFLADESNLIQRFENELASLTDHDGTIKRLLLEYDIGEVKGSARRIYVPLGFNILLNRYAPYEEYLRGFLPNLKEFKNSWKTKKVKDLYTQVLYLQKLLNHILYWGQVPLEEERSARQFGSWLDEFAKTVETAFLESFKSKNGLIRKLTLKQIANDLEISFPSNKPFSVKEKLPERINPENISKFFAHSRTIKDLARLSSYMKENLENCCIAHLRRSCIRITGFLPQKRIIDMEEIYSENTLHVLKSDLALRTTPPGSIKFTGSKIFEIKNDVIRECATPVLVVGGPGTGKTSLCRFNALIDAERYSTDSSEVIPIYFPLYRINKDTKISLKSIIDWNLKSSALIPISSDIEWDHASFRLYLDGLDEIRDPKKRKEIFEFLVNEPHNFSRCQVIVTSRDYINDPTLAKIPRVHLGGLGKKEIRSLALQWFDNDENSTNDFLMEVEKNIQIKSIVKVPLLATITILVYKRTRRLVPNKAKLYTTFVQLLSGGWDLVKGVIRENLFGSQVKIIVLSELAASLHKKKRKEFKVTDFSRAAKKTLGWKSRIQWQTLLNEIISDGLVTHAASVYQFSHLSFQEFLTAKLLQGEPNPNNLKSSISKFLNGDDWWKEVISFYIGLCENPVGFKDFVYTIPRPDFVEIDKVSEIEQMIVDIFPDLAQ